MPDNARDSGEIKPHGDDTLRKKYRMHYWIERAIAHCKINCVIAIRYDQLADGFLAMLYLAAARYWIKFVHAA